MIPSHVQSCHRNYSGDDCTCDTGNKECKMGNLDDDASKNDCTEQSSRVCETPMDDKNTNLEHSSNFESKYSGSFVKAEAQTKKDDENILGRGSPYSSFFKMSIGPLISQTVQSLYSIIDSIWVSRTLGADGLSVLGAIFIVDFVASAISLYLSTCINARISNLMGEKNSNACSQMYVDFIRVSLIVGGLHPCLILPITKPIIKFFGASENLAKMCFQYMLPASLGCFFNFLFLIGCGLLQSLGCSITYGIYQAISFLLAVCVFDPIFLIVFKTPIWGASLATVLSQAISGVVLSFFIFRGKYFISPSFAMFKSKFSCETSSALKNGISELIAELSETIPLVLMQKYITNAANAYGNYFIMVQIWAVIGRLYQLGGGFCIAFAAGALPMISYAYGAKRPKRILCVSLTCFLASTVVTVVMSTVIIIWPGEVASVWVGGNDFMKAAKQSIPICFYACITWPLQYTVSVMLLGMTQVLASTIQSILAIFLPLPLISTIMYLTGKNNPIRLYWSYTIDDAWSFIISTAFVIKPIHDCLHGKDEDIEKQQQKQ